MRVFAARYLLEITVFVCGAVVMIYEIIGSRIVSPFIGTSVYVWTSLIGVILASLSLGYWLGGRAADRRADLKILATVIFLAAGLVSVTILVKDVVLAAVSAMPAGLEIRSLVASLFLFAPASVALGFVAPCSQCHSRERPPASGRTWMVLVVRSPWMSYQPRAAKLSRSKDSVSKTRTSCFWTTALNSAATPSRWARSHNIVREANVLRALMLVGAWP